MEDKISKDTIGGDHVFPVPGNPFLKDKHDGGINPMLEAVQLDIEMEKRKIREMILRQRDLEAEVRMELMMEKQMMGMRSFYGNSSVDPYMLMDSRFQGFQEQTNQDPPRNIVFRDEREEKVHEVSMGKWPFQRDPRFVAAQIARKEAVSCQAIPSLDVSGRKRKAETSVMNEEEMVSISRKELPKKWYCSVCEVSATSGSSFDLHLNGKKHKAKLGVSKSCETTSCVVMDCDSTESSVQPVKEEKNRVQPMEEDKSLMQPMVEEKSNVQPVERENSKISKKLECSLCRISATSETLLRSHLEGKKHKAKVAKIGVSQITSDTKEDREDVKKWSCSLCQVSALSEKNMNFHLQGKKHKAKARLLPQVADDMDCNSAKEISESVKAMQEKSFEGDKGFNNEQEVNKLNLVKDGIEKESIYTESIEIEELENNDREMGRESVKFWHCKICNEGTYNEEAMDIHRKSTKHMNSLRNIGGGLVVVAHVRKKAAEDEKGSQDAALDGITDENGVNSGLIVVANVLKKAVEDEKGSQDAALVEVTIGNGVNSGIIVVPNVLKKAAEDKKGSQDAALDENTDENGASSGLIVVQNVPNKAVEDEKGSSDAALDEVTNENGVNLDEKGSEDATLTQISNENGIKSGLIFVSKPLKHET
ncbi:unnamed protein product [Amaranthus hypochondriacus]